MPLSRAPRTSLNQSAKGDFLLLTLLFCHLPLLPAETAAGPTSVLAVIFMDDETITYSPRIFSHTCVCLGCALGKHLRGYFDCFS